MIDKELIIDLMKIEQCRSDHEDRFRDLPGLDPDELFMIDFKDINGNEIKSLGDIILNYVGIPEDTGDESKPYHGYGRKDSWIRVGTPEEARRSRSKCYCRDAILDVFYDQIFFYRESEITLEKAVEIIISVGENKGWFLPEYEKLCHYMWNSEERKPTDSPPPTKELPYPESEE